MCLEYYLEINVYEQSEEIYAIHFQMFRFQPIHSDDSRMKPTRGTQRADRVSLRYQWMLFRKMQKDTLMSQ